MSYNQTPAGSCQNVRVTVDPTLGVDISGVYTYSGMGSSSPPTTLAGKPVFRYNQYCLGYAENESGGWKVDLCTKNFYNEIGFIRQAAAGSAHPTDISSGWMYYGSSTDQSSITVVCDGKLGN